MKKIVMIILVSLFLTGCMFNKTVTDDPQDKYQDFLQLLIDQESFLTASTYYDINVEMVKSQENEYRFYVVIDNPAMAMYDIQAIAVDQSMVGQEDVMAPSVGIFDNQSIHMIPNQSNIELGYSKGLVLSGVKAIADDAIAGVDLRLLIQWYNEDRSVLSKEFISVQYNHVLGNHDEPTTDQPEASATPESDDVKTDE